MAASTLTYWPVGFAGFQSDLRTETGSELSVAGKFGDESPAPWGDDLLCSNPSLVMSLWAYSLHEHAYRRNRAAATRDVERREADRYGGIALRLGEYVERRGEFGGRAWCSCCFEMTRHVRVEGRGPLVLVYLCDGCGAPTTPCLAPGCRNMASRGGADHPRRHYCAEHRHEIPSFARANARLANLDAVTDWLTFSKRDIPKATKIGVMVGVTTAVTVPLALWAAPLVGAALGSSFLGGGLTGAAATSHGLALLGGGSLAAGGYGMAGGTAVVAATGAALGSRRGAVISTAYFGEDKSFRIQKLRGGAGSAVLLASGFLSDGDDGWGDWEPIITERYPRAPVYRVHWGSKELGDVTKLAVNSAGRMVAVRAFASSAARGSVKAASKGSILLGPQLVGGFATNPWTLAQRRATMTGVLLADLIARTGSGSFVLVGHSLGAKVMLVAAQTLGTRVGVCKLDAVHMLGAAATTRGEWGSLNQSVSEHVWNYHSHNDAVLKRLFRVAKLGRHAIGAEGIEPRLSKIRNVDVSRYVLDHSDYFERVRLR